MIRSGLERRLRRNGGGKSWEYTMGMWTSIVQKDLSNIFASLYTKPIHSRRNIKRYGIRNCESLVFPMFYHSNEFPPDQPHEKSVPRSNIRETSAEADGDRAVDTNGDERKGLERPSSGSGGLI